jgi:hypothetical protein
VKKSYNNYEKSQESSFHDTSIAGVHPGEGSPGSGEAGSGGDLLPCLSNNNSIEIDQKEALKGLVSLLSPYWKKSAQTLFLNVERLAKEAKSLGHLGFLTLTFKDNITDNKEAARRFNSINSNFFNQDPRFSTKIITKEPQQKTRAAWHYHILITLSEDIREGVDFEALTKRNYRSASPYLRQLWKDIRSACEKYGFGRSELMPIKSSSEAIGRYIGKYISKGLEHRSDGHKGVRLVTYSKGWSRNSPKFAWNTPNAYLWRIKVELFAKIHGCTEIYQLTEKLGPGWCWNYLHDIMNILEKSQDHLKEWQYEKNLADGNRTNKETGEIQCPEQYLHKDKVFKAISKNHKEKQIRLEAEKTGKLGPRDTQKEVDRRRRKKEEEKTNTNNQLLWLQIEEQKDRKKEKNEFSVITTEEQISRKNAATERLENIQKHRDQEKIELLEIIKNIEDQQEWLKTLPEAPF